MSTAFDDFHRLTSKSRSILLKDEDFLKDLLRTNLKEERYLHSLNVADLCKELAPYHHVDPKKAYLAGLLHDVTKYLSEEEHDSYFRYYDPDKIAYPEKVKHSFSAKYYLKEKLHLHDKDILNAIYNHTICKSKDRLTLILYIADKREKGRNIEDGVVDLAKKDLRKAYDLCITNYKKYKK